MSVTINGVIDGITYSNITKVITGGKTINLSGVADGSDIPAGIAEIKMGTFKPESIISSDYNVAHGCNGTPDIIILDSDYETAYSSSSKPANTVIVGETYINGLGKSVIAVGTTYEGGTPASTVTGITFNGSSDGMITSVDDTNFTIGAKSNRRLDTPVTYTWIAIRLA